MRETKLEINPFCHFVMTEYLAFERELSLDYTEHSPAHGYSDTDTSTAITKEKAQEIISFLQAFVAE